MSQQPPWQAIPKQLGFPHPVGNGALYPGAERERLLGYLLARLLYPASLESVLNKLTVSPPAGASIEECSLDEQLSQKYAMLLSTVGIPATADLVRGNTGHDANIAFLDYLASTVLMQRQVEQSATDPQQPATSLGAEAKTLEFACDKFLAITSEAAPLFPSDITKMLQQYSSDADGMLAHCHQHTQVLAQSAERLQQEIDALAQEVAPCTPEEWARLCSDIQHALDAFLNDIHLFLDTYDKELHVWCEHLEPPVTHGFGQQAAAMLEAYHKLWRVLDSMASIKQIHSAMTSSQPPLQMYHPEELQQVARAGQQEIAKLMQEVEVLTRAAQRQKSLLGKAKPWAVLAS